MRAGVLIMSDDWGIYKKISSKCEMRNAEFRTELKYDNQKVLDRSNDGDDEFDRIGPYLLTNSNFLCINHRNAYLGESYKREILLYSYNARALGSKQ